MQRGMLAPQEPEAAADAARAAMPAGARRVFVVGGSAEVARPLLLAARAQGRTAGTVDGSEPKPRPPGTGTPALREAVPDLGAGDAVILLSGALDGAGAQGERGWSDASGEEIAAGVAHAAAEAGARVVFVSTEEVFDGVRGGYTEEDPTAPATEFGRQALAVEDAVRASARSWAIARTGWTVGWERDPRCRVFVTYKALMRRGARMAEDNIFTLTDAGEVCAALLRLADSDENGIWHVAGAPPLSRTDLADWILETSRHAGRMRYERVRFADAADSEPQPERTWIVNRKVEQTLGIRFSEPWRTVERKVALIDQWYDERRQRLRGPEI